MTNELIKKLDRTITDLHDLEEHLGLDLGTMSLLDMTKAYQDLCTPEVLEERHPKTMVFMVTLQNMIEDVLESAKVNMDFYQWYIVVTGSAFLHVMRDLRRVQSEPRHSHTQQVAVLTSEGPLSEDRLRARGLIE